MHANLATDMSGAQKCSGYLLIRSGLLGPQNIRPQDGLDSCDPSYIRRCVFVKTHKINIPWMAFIKK